MSRVRRDGTLRVAHVGLSIGHAGSFDDSKPRLLHDFRRLENVEVVAYCELYDSSFLDTAKRYDPAAGLYSSVEELIAGEDFDLACVVLYPRDLPGALLELAEAGKHFTVDKQFAVSSKELHDVVRAVRRNRLTTFIQYPWRFHPAMRDLRRFIDDGILGRPLDVESRQFWFQVGGPMGREVSGPYRKDIQGGGVLHHMGCHHLDLMRGVMGCEVKSVQATIGRPVGNMEEPLEDIAVLGLEFENGAYGSLHNGYTKPATVDGWQPYDSAFLFRGSEGWAEWSSVGGSRLEVHSASPRWRGAPDRTFDYELTRLPSRVGRLWYYAWIERFIEDVRVGRPGALNMDDALYVLQTIDAAYESARTGRRIEVSYGLDV